VRVRVRVEGEGEGENADEDKVVRLGVRAHLEAHTYLSSFFFSLVYLHIFLLMILF
jgi:hypothetical protein